MLFFPSFISILTLQEISNAKEMLFIYVMFSFIQNHNGCSSSTWGGL